MNKILNKYKQLEISLQNLKAVLGNDLYNVSDIIPQKIYAKDVIYAIEKYISKAVTLQELVDWVNVVWFTDLFEYNTKEENTIASVMSLLETLDEDITFSDKEYSKMIDCLKNNVECSLDE